MKVLFSVINYCFNSIIRNLYWLLRLTQSDIGAHVKMQFPIIREGKGVFRIGSNSILQKNVVIRVGVNGLLDIENKSALHKGSLIVVNKDSSLRIGNNFSLGENSKFYINENWNIGSGVAFATHCAVFSRESGCSGKLQIGNNSFIGDYAILDLSANVTIGNDVGIGPRSTFYTHDHIYTDKSVPAWKAGVIKKSIIIGDGAWIGSNVTILPGVTVGKRAVIAAGSIVTKDVEGESIWGGIPAKLIKRIV